MAEIVVLTSPTQATRVDGDTAAVIFRTPVLDPEGSSKLASIAEHLRRLGWPGAVISLVGEWDFAALDEKAMLELGWVRRGVASWRDHAKAMDCFCAALHEPCRFHEGFAAGLAVDPSV